MPIYSYDRYDADGSTDAFAITVDYISTAHLEIYLDGVLQSSGYTIDSSINKVTFSSTPGSGVVVLIQRNTPKTKATYQAQIADFQNGSVLSEKDLDNAVLGLLYVAQESEDAGNTNAISKNLVTNSWDAESLRVGNIATPTDTNDAVTKAYVDAVSLYDSPTAPYTWSLSGNGSTTAFTLAPTPTATDVNMFIVEVDGVIKKPTAEYTIAGSTITFSAPAPASGTNNITVRNFGVARDILAQPVRPSGASEAGMVVRGLTSQAGNLQEWQDVDLNVKGKVAADGDATFVDVNATGNAAVSGTLAVTGATTLSGGISGDTTISGGTTVNSLASVGNVDVNTNKFNIVGASGNTSVAGTLDAAGAVTAQTTMIVTGLATFQAGANMNSTVITGVASPGNDTEAANKAYVDSKFNTSVYGIKKYIDMTVVTNSSGVPTTITTHGTGDITASINTATAPDCIKLTFGSAMPDTNYMAHVSVAISGANAGAASSERYATWIDQTKATGYYQMDFSTAEIDAFPLNDIATVNVQVLIIS
jgi:hypothetical protein